MNWAMPWAPLGLIALASKRLSCQITRAKNSTGSAFSAADCSNARQMSSTVGSWADGSSISIAVDGGAFSLLSGVAGVAPACALAGAFAKATANASSGPTIRRIGVSFCFDDSKTRVARDRCRRRPPKNSLRLPSKLGDRGNDLLHAQMTSPCPAWGRPPATLSHLHHSIHTIPPQRLAVVDA